MLGRSSGEAMHQHQHQHQEYQQRQRQAREGALSIGNTARASIGTVATVCSGRHPSRQSHVLKCNRCVKPLATTCYLCKCDCIFCEGEFLLRQAGHFPIVLNGSLSDSLRLTSALRSYLVKFIYSTSECTFDHFSKSADCPKCRRTLGESDFTELVVADAAGSMTDISKTSLQALFANQSPSGHLPHNEICRALLNQFDVTRQSTKFLLKQLLVDSSQQGANRANMARMVKQHRADVTRLKQQHNAEKLRTEGAIQELHQRVRAKEAQYGQAMAKIQERDALIAKFKEQLGARVVGGPKGHQGSGGIASHSNGTHRSHRHSMPAQMVPPSSSHGGGNSRMSLGSSRLGSGQIQGPINGFIAQENHKSRQQQALLQQRRGPVPLPSSHGLRRPLSIGATRQQHHPNFGHQPENPYLRPPSRPYSTNSLGSAGISAPPTPGNQIRNLAQNKPYQFSAPGISSGAGAMPPLSQQQQQQQPPRYNKRRRHTPSSSSGMGYGMTPGTSMLLNQGPQTMRR